MTLAREVFMPCTLRLVCARCEERLLVEIEPEQLARAWADQHISRM